MESELKDNLVRRRDRDEADVVCQCCYEVELANSFGLPSLFSCMRTEARLSGAEVPFFGMVNFWLWL